ncbi:hypothetical protein L1887_03888 [Cichorium endivia]|nr:hypothetical protein L1887_03888 [Cichorium endivia]
MKYGLLPGKSFENDASSRVAPRNPSNDGDVKRRNYPSFLHHVPLGHNNEKTYEARLQELDSCFTKLGVMNSELNKNKSLALFLAE